MITPEKRKEYIDVLQECLDTKWLDPKPGTFMGTADGCAACDSYVYCSSCPISKGINVRGCMGTPVWRDDEAAKGFSCLSRAEWTAMVDDERELLESLITHLKNERDLDSFTEFFDYPLPADS